MKILQIYNEQRSRFGGEPAVVEATSRVLTQNGHDSRLIMKSSRSLESSLFRRFCAFWGGVYNMRTFYEMRRLLQDDRPDVVHVHSVYPMFSPSIFVACRRESVPVVMTVHSQILTCPTWYHLYKGRVCEECIGGHEFRCVMKNCRNNMLESVAYALRSWIARRFRLFHDNIDLLIVHTSFMRDKLLKAGFRPEQLVVVPNPTCVTDIPAALPSGEYVAFAGRVSPEKGVDVLLAAASLLPDIPFKIAGDGPVLSELRAHAPQNVEFLGRLQFHDLLSFYRRARILVVPSICFDLFPGVATDAMAFGLPVIASRIGGLPSVVDDGVTGYLFEPGDAAELAKRTRQLWEERDSVERMGMASRLKVQSQYSSESYYKNLIHVYKCAIDGSSAVLKMTVASA